MYFCLQSEFTRARGYYLYAHGKRYVDLDLCNGKAVWGHSPHASSTRIKNTLSQGIWGTLITRHAKQFLKVFMQIFSHYNIQGLVFLNHDLQVYENFHVASMPHSLTENTVKNNNNDIGVVDIFNCIFPYISQDNTSNTKNNTTKMVLWRPYCGISFDDFYYLVNDKYDNKIAISPLIPFAWANLPLFLCKKTDIAFSQNKSNNTMSSHSTSHIKDTTLYTIASTINPVILTGLTYSLLLLQKYGTVVRMPPTNIKNRRDILIIDCNTSKTVPGINNTSSSTSNQTNKYKNKYNQVVIHVPFPNKLWQQHGIYVTFPITDLVEYQYIREIFFEHGFYVSSQSLYTQGTKTYVYITLPAFFTKHELIQWEKTICILQTLYKK